MPKCSNPQNSKIGYNALPDECKDKIAKYLYRHLCRGVPGHYLDMPVSEEMHSAGFGNGWVESGDAEMVRDEIDQLFS